MTLDDTPNLVIEIMSLSILVGLIIDVLIIATVGAMALFGLFPCP